MSEWKLIATAPRDGTEILVSNGNWIAVTRWEAFARVDHEHDRMIETPAWVGESCDDPFYSYALEPTHWMELPALPKMEKPPTP